MKLRKHLIAIACASVLVGCGGGEDPKNEEVKKDENIAITEPTQPKEIDYKLTVVPTAINHVIGYVDTDERQISIFNDPNRISFYDKTEGTTSSLFIGENSVEIKFDDALIEFRQNETILSRQDGTKKVVLPAYSAFLEDVLSKRIDTSIYNTSNIKKFKPAYNSPLSNEGSGQHFKVKIYHEDYPTVFEVTPAEDIKMYVSAILKPNEIIEKTGLLGQPIELYVEMEHLDDGFYQSKHPINLDFFGIGQPDEDSITDILRERCENNIPSIEAALFSVGESILDLITGKTLSEAQQLAINAPDVEMLLFALITVLEKDIKTDAQIERNKKREKALKYFNNLISFFELSSIVLNDDYPDWFRFVACNSEEWHEKLIYDTGIIYSEGQIQVNIPGEIVISPEPLVFDHSFIEETNPIHDIALMATPEWKLTASPVQKEEPIETSSTNTFEAIEKKHYELEFDSVIEYYDPIAEVQKLNRERRANDLPLIEATVEVQVSGSDEYTKNYSLDSEELYTDTGSKTSTPSGALENFDTLQISSHIFVPHVNPEKTGISRYESKTMKINFSKTEEYIEHTCEGMAKLNPDEMTYSEAVEYCAATGARLPTNEEFFALSIPSGSSQDECGLPKGFFWTSSPTETEGYQWAHNSFILVGSTTWSAERNMYALCTDSEEPYKRTN